MEKERLVCYIINFDQKSKLLRLFSNFNITKSDKPLNHRLGTSQVSRWIFPRSLLELEIVLVPHLEGRLKLFSEDQGARTHKSSLHRSLLLANTPLYWISVIDWTL